MRITTLLTLLTISLTLCASSQTKVYMHIASRVEFIVTDPLGRKTGIDRRFSKPVEQSILLEQIPSAVIDYENSNEGGPSTIVFEVSLVSPQADGIYTIELIGDTTKVLLLSAYVIPSVKNAPVQHPYFEVDGIPIEKDSATTYLFTYHGALGAPVSLVKVVSARSLVRDVAAMFKLNWIKSEQTADKYLNFIGTYNTQMQQTDFSGARSTLTAIIQNIVSDSSNSLTTDACKSLRPDVEYLLAQLPASPPSGLAVKLVNSPGTNLTGGSLQYYDGAWKDAVNNNDGTFRVNTTLATVSLRMTYEGGSQTKSNVIVGIEPVVFQTVNTLVKLQNSVGSPIDTGTVQYYFSAWKDFGATTNGVATKELLPGNYTFRMTYATASNDKQQDIGTNPTVVFTTVNAAVQLKNSQGSFIDQGTVQYYFSSWQNLGTTTNGVATKELLPANYTFRMAYASATNDKQQNIGTNATVVFQTVNAAVQLKNSQGSLIDRGTVQYYFSSWKNLGSTTNGVATKELLPGNYTFRMSYETVTNDKVQDISTNSTVSFFTVLCTVRVRNSQSQPVDGAQISYYFSSWRQIGTTVNGEVTKELLPSNLTFRMNLGTTQQDKVQNIGTNALVEFGVQ